VVVRDDGGGGYVVLLLGQRRHYWGESSGRRGFAGAVLPGQAWLGNPLGIPRNSAIILIPDLLNSGIFIGILFF
jgi:hypothetical protein